MWYWVVLDLLLLVLSTLRVTRLFTTDSIPGKWWIQHPLNKKAYGSGGPAPKWSRYLDGLECPFCIGFWIGCVALLTLYLVGGIGHAAEWWRWLAGAFALNYLVGHVSSRLE